MENIQKSIPIVERIKSVEEEKILEEKNRKEIETNDAFIALMIQQELIKEAEEQQLLKDQVFCLFFF